MTYYVIYEVPWAEINKIADELREAAALKKVTISLNNHYLTDYIHSYLHQIGTYAWLVKHIENSYRMLIMFEPANNNGSAIAIGTAKPWISRLGPPSNFGYDNIPILFVFEDSADAVLFKMTFGGK